MKALVNGAGIMNRPPGRSASGLSRFCKDERARSAIAKREGRGEKLMKMRKMEGEKW